MNRLENILCSYRIAKEYESTTSRNAEQGRQYILLIKKKLKKKIKEINARSKLNTQLHDFVEEHL